MSKYTKVADLVSKIRNARYGEMVRYVETLIECGDWRDFTTPVGTRFHFLEYELDYFLLAMEIEPTLIQHAYNYAPDIADLAAKRMRLSDLVGRTNKRKYTEDERRPKNVVAKELESDPSGASQRILAGGKFVSDNDARIAGDSKRRKQAEQGKPVRRETRHMWRVRWTDNNKTTAQAIVDGLLADPDLADEVCKQLRNKLYNAKTGTRRSSAQTDDKSGPPELRCV